MWLLFGAASKKKPIAGGIQDSRWCDDCKTTRTFVECEIEDKIDVFFIPVLNGKSRALVCCECGEDVELKAPKPQAPPPKLHFSEREKDAMLAALKKKMRAT